VRDAVIVPPTTQNHRAIEEDLRAQAPDLARLSHEAATARAEQAVRNYDPCISCSTHFLKLTLVQR
jgi:coenzyme F420-reducing hydrogenase alpha subunit